jgi:hypothetical protein
MAESDVESRLEKKIKHLQSQILSLQAFMQRLNNDIKHPTVLTRVKNEIKVTTGDLLGTTNQVNVLRGTGAVIRPDDTVLSLPQDIHTGATPTFAGVTLGGVTNKLLVSSGGTLTIEGTARVNSIGVPKIISTTSSATPTPNCDTTEMYILTALGVAAAFGIPTGTPSHGQRLIIRIKDDGTIRALSWNAIYRVVGTTLPVATVASKYIYVFCVYNTTDTKWDVLAVNQEV